MLRGKIVSPSPSITADDERRHSQMGHKGDERYMLFERYWKIGKTSTNIHLSLTFSLSVSSPPPKPSARFAPVSIHSVRVRESDSLHSQTHSIIDDKLNNCKTSIKNLLIVKIAVGMNEGWWYSAPFIFPTRCLVSFRANTQSQPFWWQILLLLFVLLLFKLFYAIDSESEMVCVEQKLRQISNRHLKRCARIDAI